MDLEHQIEDLARKLVAPETREQAIDDFSIFCAERADEMEHAAIHGEFDDTLWLHVYDLMLALIAQQEQRINSLLGVIQELITISTNTAGARLIAYSKIDWKHGGF